MWNLLKRRYALFNRKTFAKSNDPVRGAAARVAEYGKWGILPEVQIRMPTTALNFALPRVTKILSLALLLYLAGRSYVTAAPANNVKLTAHEQGTWEIIQPSLRALKANLTGYRQANRVVAQHRAGGANHDHSDQVWPWLNNLRDWAIQPWTGPNPARIVPPESMNELIQARRDFLLFGRDIYSSMRADGISNAQWQKLLVLAHEVVLAEERFHSVVNARTTSYADAEMSYNLSVQLKPIPLRLDFIKGEVKIVGTRDIGPLRFSSGAGVSASRGGVTTIAIVDDDQVRFFATGGRTIEFLIPASHVRIEGSRMVITALPDKSDSVSLHQ